ncbi:unnamed protein product [Mytilus edulis]|uniref:CARD domain-containing protein n=1 Tax=Mytilus edulis TaxID=6550 RepID=A0A8S3RH48_MYTED|nr:unnamed protein product [Mytilus edulis]
MSIPISTVKDNHNGARLCYDCYPSGIYIHEHEKDTMYVYEKRALKRCQHAMSRDLNPNTPLLSQLEKGHVIDSSQSSLIMRQSARKDKVLCLIDILFEQEDGVCIRLINALKLDYPWISSHLHREFIKEKTKFTREFNQGLSNVVNKQISPMVLGPGAEECPVPTTSKESLQCVETVSELLETFQKLNYRHLGVDPIEVCNMALCVVLEEKITQYKKTIDNLQEKLTKLKVPTNNIRVIKQEILNEKEAAKLLEKQIKIKDSAISHLEYQNALLKQKREALRKTRDMSNDMCAVCNSKCLRRQSSFNIYK